MPDQPPTIFMVKCCGSCKYGGTHTDEGCLECGKFKWHPVMVYHVCNSFSPEPEVWGEPKSQDEELDICSWQVRSKMICVMTTLPCNGDTKCRSEHCPILKVINDTKGIDSEPR